MPHAISLANLLTEKNGSTILSLSVKLLDKLLGISRMNALYQKHDMAGLDKQAFAQKLIEILQLKVLGKEQLQSSIPKSGPVVIASNHPFGGIEGVILSLLISQVRPDLKVLANKGLQLFPELRDFFIFTNPLSERDPKNTPSIRSSLQHVKQGGALLIFPAGRVAYYHKDTKRIADHQWNRLVARLCNATGAPFLGLFVEGQNSPLFYRLGRIYYRFRLLMLARELLKKQKQTIRIETAQLVSAKKFNAQCDTTTQAQILRGISYAQDPNWRYQWPENVVVLPRPLAPAVNWQEIEAELNELPPQQLLLEHKEFAVFYGYAKQLPKTVLEISRLRELVFRELNEGSGSPIDTDKYDQTYTQLFVVNRTEKRIIGAYRMGQTDKLLATEGTEQLYLSKMFNFSSDFVNQNAPCLELGRSFLIPQYQRSFQGLYLLWRGIGAFVCKYPHYRTLYGTVSLSKLYDPRSVSLMEAALVKPSKAVTARSTFNFPLHPELAELLRTTDLKPHLSTLLASIEADNKDIPVLARHYLKLGAQFHCLGIDRNFNNTPGLLLSVDLPNAPDKLLKLYLGDNWQRYKNYNQ